MNVITVLVITVAVYFFYVFVIRNNFGRQKTVPKIVLESEFNKIREDLISRYKQELRIMLSNRSILESIVSDLEKGGEDLGKIEEVNEYLKKSRISISNARVDFESARAKIDKALEEIESVKSSVLEQEFFSSSLSVLDSFKSSILEENLVSGNKEISKFLSTYYGK